MSEVRILDRAPRGPSPVQRRVVQLAEHRSHKPDVAGSSPAAATKVSEPDGVWGRLLAGACLRAWGSGPPLTARGEPGQANLGSPRPGFEHRGWQLHCHGDRDLGLPRTRTWRVNPGGPGGCLESCSRPATGVGIVPSARRAPSRTHRTRGTAACRRLEKHDHLTGPTTSEDNGHCNTPRG